MDIPTRYTVTIIYVLHSPTTSRYNPTSLSYTLPIHPLSSSDSSYEYPLSFFRNISNGAIPKWFATASASSVPFGVVVPVDIAGGFARANRSNTKHLSTNRFPSASSTASTIGRKCSWARIRFRTGSCVGRRKMSERVRIWWVSNTRFRSLMVWFPSPHTSEPSPPPITNRKALRIRAYGSRTIANVGMRGSMSRARRWPRERIRTRENGLVFWRDGRPGRRRF